MSTPSIKFQIRLLPDFNSSVVADKAQWFPFFLSPSLTPSSPFVSIKGPFWCIALYTTCSVEYLYALHFSQWLCHTPTTSPSRPPPASLYHTVWLSHTEWMGVTDTHWRKRNQRQTKFTAVATEHKLSFWMIVTGNNTLNLRHEFAPLPTEPGYFFYCAHIWSQKWGEALFQMLQEVFFSLSLAQQIWSYLLITFPFPALFWKVKE